MPKLIDLTGKNIGDWEVIEYAGKSMWRCKCKCGKENLVDGKSLRNGKSKSCGSCASKKRMEYQEKFQAKYQDISGMKFGKLTVVKRGGINKRGRHVWICSCECGGTKEAEAYDLISGKIKSCGCLAQKKNKAKKKTSNRRSRSYRNPSLPDTAHVLYGMQTRCYNKSNPSYKNYGGRGIKICDEWMDKEHGVENFIKWCSESGYKKGLTIERIDNDGDYCPENCKWATKAEQSCNRRNTILVLCNGTFVPISKMASETGLEDWKIRYKVKNSEIPYIRGGFPKEQN